jgi:hypothetical protein
MANVMAWHFAGPKLRDGRPLPKDGEWAEEWQALRVTPEPTAA